MINYPLYANINGKKYPLNTSYKIGIKCLQIVNDRNISDTERSLAVIYKLFGFIPTSDLDVFLEKAILFLQCGKKDDGEAHSVKFDHVKDFQYITASFASDYHIDLTKEDLHWWRYIELLGGLTDKSVMSRVLYIRDYDMRDLKDPKARADMLRAKREVALDREDEFTDEERRIIEQFENAMKGG